jgi:predicted Zn-dependent protease
MAQASREERGPEPICPDNGAETQRYDEQTGCRIRVLSGERTGYAYTDNLNPERLLHAARTAALRRVCDCKKRIFLDGQESFPLQL